MAHRRSGGRRAGEELDGFHLANVAAGYIEIGEIRRRHGDLDGAEEAFVKAEELRGQRTAGLALLRLAQRRLEAATEIITVVLQEQPWNRLARGKLLPARVQIAVAAGELESAASAAEELDRIAADCESPALRAAALTDRPRTASAGPGRQPVGLRYPPAGAAAGAGAQGPVRGGHGSPPARSGLPELRRRDRCGPSLSAAA